MLPIILLTTLKLHAGNWLLPTLPYSYSPRRRRSKDEHTARRFLQCLKDIRRRSIKHFYIVTRIINETRLVLVLKNYIEMPYKRAFTM